MTSRSLSTGDFVKMFEAKLGQAAILKRITEAVKDLVTDAPFDCTEGAMCLQVRQYKVVSYWKTIYSLLKQVSVDVFRQWMRPTWLWCR